MRSLSLLAFTTALALGAQTVPTTINYQGRLTDNSPSQTPVNSTVPMRFTIWDDPTAGTNLWQEPASGGVNVLAVNGIFNIALGANGVPLPATVFSGANSLRYLEITLNPGAGNEEVLTPRQRLAASGYAALAQSANNAATVTNGVYTTGGYADPVWITSLDSSKITGLSGGYIKNSTTPQAGASFNIGGGGTLGGALSAAGNGVIHNAFIGDVGWGPDWAGFSHIATADQNHYALLVNNLGEVDINHAAGQQTYFISNNATVLASLADDGFFLNVPFLKAGSAGNDPIVRFSHTNLTQGVGIGYNTILALGSNANQDLNLAPRGTGVVGVTGGLTVSGGVKALNNLEIVQVADPRLIYTPNKFTCSAGNWCSVANSYGANRFSTDASYTFCSGADCSANRVELRLDNNDVRTVLLSDLDWDGAGSIAVHLSFDGGATYAFLKTINTYRNPAATPYISSIRAVASNLPLGVNVRVRLIATSGRFIFEGFGLSRMNLPETDSPAGGCRVGFLSVADGHLCLASALNPPATMDDAIAACATLPGIPARVCTHADFQQACGAGYNPYGGVTGGWFADMGGSDDIFHTWNTSACAYNADGATAVRNTLHNFRCCY